MMPSNVWQFGSAISLNGDEPVVQDCACETGLSSCGNPANPGIGIHYGQTMSNRNKWAHWKNTKPDKRYLVRGCLVILLLVLGPVILFIPITELLNHLPDGGVADVLKVYPILSWISAVVLLLYWLMKALD